MKYPCLLFLDPCPTSALLGGTEGKGGLYDSYIHLRSGVVLGFLGLGVFTFSFLYYVQYNHLLSFFFSQRFRFRHAMEDEHAHQRRFGNSFAFPKNATAPLGRYFLRRGVSRSDGIIEALHLFWSFWGKATEQDAMDLLAISSTSAEEWDNEKIRCSSSETDRSKRDPECFPFRFFFRKKDTSGPMESNAHEPKRASFKNNSGCVYWYSIHAFFSSTIRRFVVGVCSLRRVFVRILWKKAIQNRDEPPQRHGHENSFYDYFSDLQQNSESQLLATPTLPLFRTQGTRRSGNGRRKKTIPSSLSSRKKRDANCGKLLRDVSILFLLKPFQGAFDLLRAKLFGHSGVMEGSPWQGKRIFSESKPFLPTLQFLGVPQTMELISSYFEPLIPTPGRCPTVVVLRVMSLDGIGGDYCSYSDSILKQLKLDSCFTEDDLVDIICIAEQHPASRSSMFAVTQQEKNEEEVFELPSPSSSTARSTVTAVYVQGSSASLSSGHMRVEIYPARMFYMSLYLSLLLQEKNNAILSIYGDLNRNFSHSMSSVSAVSMSSAFQDLQRQRSASARSYLYSSQAGCNGDCPHPGVKSVSRASYYLSVSSAGPSLFAPNGRTSSKQSESLPTFCGGTMRHSGGGGRRIPDKVFYNYAFHDNRTSREVQRADVEETKEKKHMKEKEESKTEQMATGTPETFSHPQSNALFVQSGEETPWMITGGGPRRSGGELGACIEGVTLSNSPSENAISASAPTVFPSSPSSFHRVASSCVYCSSAAFPAHGSRALSTGYYSEKVDFICSSSTFAPPTSSVVVQSKWQLYYLSQRSNQAIRSADALLLQIRQAMDESVRKYCEEKHQSATLRTGKPHEEGKRGGAEGVQSEGYRGDGDGRPEGMNDGGRRGIIPVVHQVGSPSSTIEREINGSPSSFLRYRQESFHTALPSEGGPSAESGGGGKGEHLPQQNSNESFLSLIEELGVRERQQRRDRILKAVETHMTKVCIIPLPDNRIYCDLPSSVSRIIAAHTRGFSPLKTLAEDWVAYSRFVSFLLEQRRTSPNPEEDGWGEFQRKRFYNSKETAIIRASHYVKDCIALLSVRNRETGFASSHVMSATEKGTDSEYRNVAEQEKLRERRMNEHFLASSMGMGKKNSVSESLESYFSPKIASTQSLVAQRLSFPQTTKHTVGSTPPSPSSPFVAKEGVSSPSGMSQRNGTNATNASANDICTHTTMRIGGTGSACNAKATEEGLSPFGVLPDKGAEGPASLSFSASLGFSSSVSGGGRGVGEGSTGVIKNSPGVGDTSNECRAPYMSNAPMGSFDANPSGARSPREVTELLDTPATSRWMCRSSTTLHGLSSQKPSREALLLLQGDFCYQSFVRNVNRVLSNDRYESYTSEEKWKENGRRVFYVFTNPSSFLFSASAGVEVNVEDDFWLCDEGNEPSTNENRKEEGEARRKKLDQKASSENLSSSRGLHISDFSGNAFKFSNDREKGEPGVGSRQWRTGGSGRRVSVSSGLETSAAVFFQTLKEIRDKRNTPLLPLFRYLHSHFFDTITRPLRAHSSPMALSYSPRLHSRIISAAVAHPSHRTRCLSMPLHHSSGSRSSSWVRFLGKLLHGRTSLVAAGRASGIEDSTGTSMDADAPLPDLDIPSSSSTCAHSSSLSTTTSNRQRRPSTPSHDPSPCLHCFGGHTIPLSEVDRTTSQYGLTPLENWMCVRYSQRCAAEVYMMDVLAAKGDIFIPTMRVIDEVVAHAVFVHHNFIFKEFVDDLRTEFNLEYIPKTPWGERMMVPTPAQYHTLKQKGGERGVFAEQVMDGFISQEISQWEEGTETEKLLENKWDAGIAEAGVECFGEAEEQMNLEKELEHLKPFLIQHRHTLSSAMFTPPGANRLESVFGVPSTVFPFLLCQRESVSLVHIIYQSLNSFYGELTYGHFHRFIVDVFGNDRPDVVRHAARIFRTLNRSRTGCISYEELCGWLARKLSCSSDKQPDVQLLTVLMSLRLPMALLLDRKKYWSQRDVAFRFSLDCEDDFH